LKKIILILFVFAMSIWQQAQAQLWDWAKQVGSTGSDKVTCIRTDSFGYVYACGYFTHDIAFPGGITLLETNYGSSGKEMFLAKFDSFGICQWAKSAAKYFDVRALGMDVDENGNSIIVGTFWNDLDVGGISLSPVNGCCDQCFVVRFDKNGNFLWGTSVSDNGDDQGLDVALDDFGNGYISGFMSGSTIFCEGSGLSAANVSTDHCYWVAKINAAGTWQWIKTYGNMPVDTPYTFKYVERDNAICVDRNQFIYLTGGFRDGPYDFRANNLTSNGSDDVYVVKMDVNGNFIWAKNFGSKDGDWGNGICADGKGNVYITGEYRDSMVLSPTILVKNYKRRDAFVVKIDINGNYVWGKRAGSDFGSERGNDVWADTFGVVYVSGDIGMGAKFGSFNTPASDSVNAFVARIQAIDGEWLWVVTGGGPLNDDRANSVYPYRKNNSVYTCGFFKPSAIYGTDMFNIVAKTDGYLGKIYDSYVVPVIIPPVIIPPIDSITANQIIVFPNAFAPNGKNNYFIALVNKEYQDKIAHFEIKIYNRWGQLIFESYDVNKKWDGMFNKKMLPMEAYVYNCNFTLLDGSKKQLKGSVSLLR
jgi:gliding motility-associated-like protein